MIAKFPDLLSEAGALCLVAWLSNDDDALSLPLQQVVRETGHIRTQAVVTLLYLNRGIISEHFFFTKKPQN